MLQGASCLSRARAATLKRNSCSFAAGTSARDCAQPHAIERPRAALTLRISAARQARQAPKAPKSDGRPRLQLDFRKRGRIGLRRRSASRSFTARTRPWRCRRSTALVLRRPVDVVDAPAARRRGTEARRPRGQLPRRRLALRGRGREPNICRAVVQYLGAAAPGRGRAGAPGPGPRPRERGAARLPARPRPRGALRVLRAHASERARQAPLRARLCADGSAGVRPGALRAAGGAALREGRGRRADGGDRRRRRAALVSVAEGRRAAPRRLRCK